jgi:hypothetical protein|nr:hypothetical protein [Aminobacterium sp. EBM-42]
MFVPAMADGHLGLRLKDLLIFLLMAKHGIDKAMLGLSIVALIFQSATHLCWRLVVRLCL